MQGKRLLLLMLIVKMQMGQVDCCTTSKQSIIVKQLAWIATLPDSSWFGLLADCMFTTLLALRTSPLRLLYVMLMSCVWCRLTPRQPLI